MTSPVSLARRLRSPFDVPAIDPFRTLHRSARSYFDDDRLVQWAGRYATYSGSSPFRAPATLACIPHIEARFGLLVPAGRAGTIRGALARLARESGVEIRTGTEATAITTDDGGRVRGVVLVDGTELAADVVVANVDAEHLYTDLVPDATAARRVRRAERSTSGFAICAGVRGLTPGLTHHNVWFAADERGEFEAIRRGELPDDPTIYACVSAVTDPSQAPDGCENWFLLLNTPPGAEIDRERGIDVVLSRLARHGIRLRERIEFVHTMTPSDIATRYRSPGGAIYGTSSDGMRAAFQPPREPRHARRAVPRRRVEPPGRGPPPRVDQRADRRRHDRGRSRRIMTAARRICRCTWFAAPRSWPVPCSRAGAHGRGGSSGAPDGDALPIDQRRDTGPRRGRADRPVARPHRRCARCCRGDRGRRRIGRRDGRTRRPPRRPGRARRTPAARMGRQGVGTPAGADGRHHRVGRHARRRHPTRPGVGRPRSWRAPRATGSIS